MFEIFRFYLFIFLICHFMGDFYLQTSQMAEKKTGNYQKTLIHCILYAVPFLVMIAAGFFFFKYGPHALIREWNWEIIISATIFIIISHMIIDLVKCRAETKVAGENGLSPDKNKNYFIWDQLLHIGIIFIVSYGISNPIQIIPRPWFISKDLYLGIQILLYLLILLKPTNISFKKIFSKYQPLKIESENDVTIAGAGATIGSLERLLMGFFMIMGQFAAVGLIMTAKSIARYDKISKDPSFAEYYLIGTLYSMLITLAAYLLIFKFG
ncbi:DUF3307 domain-containing protein [Methanolapillus ohkumae]|uniref:DUF3307 domain-containing protein n=1 Tax=Methanolapillus ohkumae TaxID=3028298 RepID=A0AA96VF43_9EURY|nr:hypothetical protein MsAm2_10030 [Methanosarcinaceae archaeon Am2]